MNLNLVVHIYVISVCAFFSLSFVKNVYGRHISTLNHFHDISCPIDITTSCLEKIM